MKEHVEILPQCAERFRSGDEKFEDVKFLKRSAFLGLLGNAMQIGAMIWFIAVSYSQLQYVNEITKEIYPKVNKLVYLHEKDFPR